MCRSVACKTCGGTTWSGCGMHVDQVMRDIPAKARCTCVREAQERWFRFSRRKG